jgi:hypothetical protein
MDPDDVPGIDVPVNDKDDGIVFVVCANMFMLEDPMAMEEGGCCCCCCCCPLVDRDADPTLLLDDRRS